MRSCAFTPCQSRPHARRALAYGHLQSYKVNRHECHNRRINVLQCISASTNTSSLAQLSSHSLSNGHDAAGCLDVALQRRTLLAMAVFTATLLPQRFGGTARAEEAPSALGAEGSPAASGGGAPAAVPLTEYGNTRQQYRLMVPAGWDVKGKAGADVLFEDPSRRSTSVGITVNPVKVTSIQQFGGVEDVGSKLLEAERRKESTLGVSLLSSGSRVGASGATLYDYEYELDSTRGRKRILNTVTIFNSRLYILNAAFKCEKDGCGEAAEAGVQLLRRVAGTFDVTS